ncbi:MAG: cohesin domain-containing protein [Acidobacteriota bacterium]
MKRKGFVFVCLITLSLVFGLVSAASAYTLSLQATSDGSTPKISFARGEDLYLNIVLDDAGGVAGCAFTVNYPTNVLIAPATSAEGMSNDITSIFPFTYDTTQTHRENSTTDAGKIYLAGAAINTTTGGAKYSSGEIVLFTIKFKVKADAPLGNFTLSLSQTQLLNPDAGWGIDTNQDGTKDAAEPVPVLVGAVAIGEEGDNNFDCSNYPTTPCAFPVLLGDQTNPFSTISISSPRVDPEPTYSIAGTISYSAKQTGTLYVGAFDGPDPDTANKISCTPISQPGAFKIEGLPNGTYYIGAYRDSDGGVTSPDVMDRDPTEAQGMYTTPITPTAVTVSGSNVIDIDFSIFDPDGDSDGIPDYWANLYPGIGAAGDDFDQDGYSNLVEYQNGTNPTVQDAPGGTGYDNLTDNRTCPWVAITGNQYTMIVTGTATADGVDVAVGDCIAAFGPGGETDTRAVVQVTTPGDYFLTLRGNQLSGETINFKMRRGSDMKILNSIDTVEFVSDGTIIEKVLQFTTLRSQTISLIENWNWVSFNVLPEGTTLQGFFGDSLANLEQIKTQTTSMLNIGGNWIGDDQTIMSKISQFQMFKIKVKQGAAFDLTISGQPLDPQATIPLQLNWSWVAYQPDYCLPVQTAIGSVFADINQVKSQTQSRLKINDTTFIGDMNEMCPGKGYAIKMLAPGTLVYPVQP